MAESNNKKTWGRYINRQLVEDITGLHYRAIRRLEKARKFPRRVRSLVKLSAGKVRWKREAVEEWVRKDEEIMRNKVLSQIMKPGMLMQQDYGVIRFHAPPGFWFRHGAHIMEFTPCPEKSSTRIWAALWKNRDVFELKQCIMPCQHCQRQDKATFSKAEPVHFRFNRKDERRWI